MKAFAYVTAQTPETAVSLVRDQGRFLAGGIDLLGEMKERLANEGAEPVTASPRDFTNFVKDDIARWSRVVKDANIKAD